MASKEKKELALHGEGQGFFCSLRPTTLYPAQYRQQKLMVSVIVVD